MEQNQQEQRSTAAKEFQESLDQLQQILHENSAEDEIVAKLPNGNASDNQVAENSSIIDLTAWEDAVADIEQYFQQKKTQE